MRSWLLGLVCVFLAVPAFGQTVNATLVWDMPGNTVADAQGFTYALKDGTNPAIAVTPVACTTVSSVTHCSAPLQPLAPGAHSLVLTATSTMGAASSDPVTGTTPGKPTTVTITITIQ